MYALLALLVERSDGPRSCARLLRYHAVSHIVPCRIEKRAAKLNMTAEFLESNGYTVTRPGAASSAAPAAAPAAADPAGPRVTAGLDTANVRGTRGKLDNRSRGREGDAHGARLLRSGVVEREHQQSPAHLSQRVLTRAYMPGAAVWALTIEPNPLSP